MPQRLGNGEDIPPTMEGPAHQAQPAQQGPAQKALRVAGVVLAIAVRILAT